MGLWPSECGRRYAWTTYGAASVLGVLFVPDKETALFFVALLGYYPLVKPHGWTGCGRRRGAGGGETAAVQRLGAGSCTGCCWCCSPAGEVAAEVEAAALVLAAVTLLIGNVAFLLFDRALANLLKVYRLVWQPRLHKMLGKR